MEKSNHFEQLTDRIPLKICFLIEYTDYTIISFSKIKNIIQQTLSSYKEDGNYDDSLEISRLLYLSDHNKIHNRLSTFAKMLSKYDLIVAYGFGCIDAVAIQQFASIPFICVNPVYDYDKLLNSAELKKNCKFLVDNYLKKDSTIAKTNVQNVCMLISNYSKDMEDFVSNIQPYLKNTRLEISMSTKKRRQEGIFYNALMDVLHYIRIEKDNEYGYFNTPEKDRIYEYSLIKENIKTEKVFLNATKKTINSFFGNDWKTRNFTSTEIDVISQKFKNLAEYIKKYDEAEYDILVLLYPELRSNDKELVKKYLFKPTKCINPLTIVKKDSPEYQKFKNAY